MNLKTRSASASVLVLVTAVACTDRVDVGYDLPSPVGGAAASGGSMGDGGGSGFPAVAGGGSAGGESRCDTVACRGKIYACGDCEDNDGDALGDALDPECLGPCDDTEDVFATPQTGAMSCRLDCAFDRNAGLGNDRCDWDLRCDPLSPGSSVSCESTPTTLASASCESGATLQTEACVDSCPPITPNGCDCFGCCELPARSGSFVWIGAATAENGGCHLGTLDDPEVCPPCTPVSACENRCDTCEACVGGASPSATCADPAQACGASAPPCGPGASCGEGRYCLTGCCIVVPT